MTNVMSRVKVNTENGNQRDHNRKLFIFSNMLYGGGDKIMLAVGMTYHMHIELFPVLVPGVAVLIVPWGCCFHGSPGPST